MKKIFIFVILIIFVVSQPSEARREEMRQKRREHDRKIAECILKSDAASPELKKLVEENKDGDLMRALHPRDHKLERSDREVFRNCRKEMFDKLREEHRRERDRDRERDRERMRHENADGL